MLINEFEEHISYTFESDDCIYMLGMKLIKRLEINDCIPVIKVLYNNVPKLLGGIDGLKKLSVVINEISNIDLNRALKKIAESLNIINESDFIKMTSVDINFNRLFFDMKNKCIKYVILPINVECDFHDGVGWSWQFRNTLLVLLSRILVNMPKKYNEAYSIISNMENDDKTIVSYVLNYDLDNIILNEKNENKTSKAYRLILKHSGKAGDILFVINKEKYIIGKSAKTADGVIEGYDSISRRHCRICQNDNLFTVEDLESTNGTILNGYRLNSYEKYYINNGDKLVLADLEFDVIVE